MPTYINPDSGRYVINSSLNFSDLNNIVHTESALDVRGGAFVNNDLYVGGTLVVNGDIISLGNAGGTLSLNSNISSDILPSQTNTYDIGNSNYEWKSTFTNNLHLSQTPVVEIIQNFSIESTVSFITSSTQSASILPDGANGQIKIIVTTQTPSTPVTLTPTNANGFSTISFTNAGDSATMLFTNGAWNIVSNFRASVS